MKSKHLFSVLLLSFVLTAAAAAGVFAETYDLNSNTPEIKNAISSRQSRYAELIRLKSSNAIGEDNQGYVKAFSGEADAIVKAENHDRRTIYKAIVAQNQLGRDGLAHVQTAFSEVQRHKARNGESIQLPSGEWIKK